MFGQRLRLARKRKGLSLRALAELVDPKVSAQAISKYESGKMMPSSRVLVGLGKALGVTLDFLMSSQVEALEGLEFRKHARASARDRAKAEAILIDHLERYMAIEDILGDQPSNDWFENRRYDSVATKEEIDSRADALRNAWNLGMDPIPSLCLLLEEKGIKVVIDDLPQSINGLACGVLRGGEPVAYAVAVSGQVNLERKRFTLAHELAHRVIKSTGNPAIRIETAMNRFAGAFLVPRQHLLEETGLKRQRITYGEIIRLKHMYGVSAAAMLLRLGQVGVLQPAAVQRAFATFARTWRKSEPNPIRDDQGFAAFERPQRFERLVWRAVGEELISTARAAALLSVSIDTVEQQISGPPNQ